MGTRADTLSKPHPARIEDMPRRLSEGDANCRSDIGIRSLAHAGEDTILGDLRRRTETGATCFTRPVKEYEPALHE